MNAVPAGLCRSCGYGRRIVTRTGSRFLLCERSRTDQRFPRYPRLPVLTCSGYEPAAGTEDTSTPEKP